MKIAETWVHLIYLQYPDLPSSISLALPNPLCPPCTLYMNQIYECEAGGLEEAIKTHHSISDYIQIK